MSGKRKRTDDLSPKRGRLGPRQGEPGGTEDVYLFGEITDQRAEGILWEMADAVKRGKRVRLWICSLGGDLGGALALHDALARTPGSEAIATGHCLSAALIVLLGAERRWCTPNTIFLNHAISGGDGQIWPFEVGLPVLAQLGAIRAGSFGPELAKEFGIVLWQSVVESRESGVESKTEMAKAAKL